MSTENIDFVDFASAGTVPLQEMAIHLHRQDQVAIAKTNLQAGIILVVEDEAQGRLSEV